jgi:hypothetical protein
MNSPNPNRGEHPAGRFEQAVQTHAHVLGTALLELSASLQTGKDGAP